MWLIETSTLTLREFIGDDVPSYAILSHRWRSPENEVSHKEFRKGLKKETAGYAKILSFCKLARMSSIHWAWVDTCCIDKKSSAELSEAINSMFMYYENAEICIAYLSDVEPDGDWKASDWWTRGWTLQELIAPRKVHFFDRTWTSLGRRDQLAKDIAKYKKLPYSVLNNAQESIVDFSVAERLSWAANRRTTRIEDAAYSLLGMFRINIPLLYGEGKRAFIRLQLEILQKYPDDTLFAWKPVLTPEDSSPHSNPTNILAEHPSAFKNFPDRSRWPISFQIVKRGADFFGPLGSRSAPCMVTSWGIQLRTDASRLIPRETLQDEIDQSGVERWAVTLISSRYGEMSNINFTLILVRSSVAGFSYQRAECHLGGWAGSELDRNYKVQSFVENKLFYLQYDSDLQNEAPSTLKHYTIFPDGPRDLLILPSGEMVPYQTADSNHANSVTAGEHNIRSIDQTKP